LKRDASEVLIAAELQIPSWQQTASFTATQSLSWVQCWS
jgi:hypothetical protein